MANSNSVYWSVLILTILSSNFCTSAKVYIRDENSLQKVSFHNRVRRQTHPGATIAKLPSQDTGSFVPIVGPTQPIAAQQTPFANPTNFFPGNDFPSLQNVPNTLVDYLVPPSPDSPVSTLNFQDPAANLQNLQNIDNFEITASPTSSPLPSHNSNNFQPFQNTFSPQVNNFQNPLNNLQHLQTTPSTFANEQIQSVAFQNLPSAPSATPSLVPPVPSIAPTPNAAPTLSNKISNTVIRDGFTPINNANHFPINQFTVPTPPPASPSFPRTEQEKPTQQPSTGKWELGFDANEILTPPREDSFGRVGEYDTINVNKIRRPSVNLNPPVLSNEAPASQNHNQNFPPPNQFFNQFSPSQNNANQFNQLPAHGNAPNNNDLFTPITNTVNQFTPSNNQFSPNRENTNEQNTNIIWGSQKQPVSHSSTTNTPFLPTIPPSNQNLQPASNFQNVNQLPPSPQNYHPNSLFNSVPSPLPQQLQQLQYTQPPPPPQNQQLIDFNQNYPIDTPLTSQFDSFLPQGTVADHTYQQYNENGRLYLNKRQTNGEEEGEEYAEEEEPQSNYNIRPFGRPVYSFVKTDKEGHFKWSVRHPSRR